MDGWMEILKCRLDEQKKQRDGQMAIKRQLDRWLNRKNEETKQMDGQMDRREKDGRLDALLVGGWVDRDTKNGWLDGWIYIYIKTDGWMGREKTWMVEHGWLEKINGWMVRKNMDLGWIEKTYMDGWMDI